MGQTSLELLAHFDRPKTVDAPVLAWEADLERCVIGLERGDAAAVPEDFGQQSPPAALAGRGVFVARRTTRGVGWVMQWAAALAVIAFAASVLTEFAYLAAAEQRMALAARAGAWEATLPRATCESVAASVERRLASYPPLAGQLRLSLQQNGLPVTGRFRAGDGDRFSITLAAPSSAVVPGWLRAVMFWREGSQIRVHAERPMPGRKLPPARS